MGITPRSKAEKRRIIAVVAVLGIALTFFLLNQIPTPHPFVFGPDRAAAKIAESPQHRSWKVTHDYGTLCAQNLSIDELRPRGNALPKVLHHAFYDGAAHHIEVDFEDLSNQVDAIKRHIPEEYQLVFFDGIIRVYTAENGDKPDDVIARTQQLQELSGAKTLINGIRIGLQQGFGDSIGEALGIAARFPQEMHAKLFEEIGWRIGHDDDIDASKWYAHVKSVPSHADCSLAEGMTRGRILSLVLEDEPWWDPVASFREQIPNRCQNDIDSGIAEALLILVGDQPDAIETMAAELPKGTIRANILERMDSRVESLDAINFRP